MHKKVPFRWKAKLTEHSLPDLRNSCILELSTDSAQGELYIIYIYIYNMYIEHLVYTEFWNVTVAQVWEGL
jgi:hypothetical protein